MNSRDRRAGSFTSLASLASLVAAVTVTSGASAAPAAPSGRDVMLKNAEATSLTQIVSSSTLTIGGSGESQLIPRV